MSDDLYEYIRDPKEIYRRSFAAVEQASNFTHLPEAMRPLAARVVHACAMPEVAADLAWDGNPVEAATEALRSGATIFADAQMVAYGITRSRLPADNPVVCTLNDPQVASHAKSIGNTRSAAAVDFWGEGLEGAIAVFGNAPTALFRLLEHLRDGGHKPAAILAFPVGFIGAAESKDALIADAYGVPFVTLRGRRGGSAMAAAAVNAFGSEPR